MGDDGTAQGANGKAHCTVGAPAGPLTLDQDQALIMTAQGPAGLRTNGVKASFDYVVVYQLGGSI